MVTHSRSCYRTVLPPPRCAQVEGPVFRCDYGGPAPLGLRGYEGLTALCLGDTPLPALPPRLTALTRLRELRLGGGGGESGVEDRFGPPHPWGALAALGALTRLGIAGTGVNVDREGPHLAQLSGLRRLELEEVTFWQSDADDPLNPWWHNWGGPGAPHFLGSLSGLTRLSLVGSQYTELPWGLAVLHGLKVRLPCSVPS